MSELAVYPSEFSEKKGSKARMLIATDVYFLPFLPTPSVSAEFWSLRY